MKFSVGKECEMKCGVGKEWEIFAENSAPQKRLHEKWGERCFIAQSETLKRRLSFYVSFTPLLCLLCMVDIFGVVVVVVVVVVLSL